MIKKISSTYLRGILVILLLHVAIETGKQVYEGFEPLITSLFGISRMAKSAGIPMLLLLPFLAGLVANLGIEKFQKRRGIRAFQHMESRLSTQLEPGETKGYQIVLIPWPTEKIRTVGVITSTFCDPQSGKELASVFIPNTPDASNGTVKVVAVGDLETLSWKLKDLTMFHLTYGSANPE